MAINGAKLDAQGHLVLEHGERIVFKKDDVKFSLDKRGKDFKDIPGAALLTEKRIVFIAKKPKYFSTFEMPKATLHELDVKQPLLGANSFVGKVDAMPDGGFEGTAEFKMSFGSGGAVEMAKMTSLAFQGRLPVGPAPGVVLVVAGQPGVPPPHPQFGYGQPPLGYASGPPPGYLMHGQPYPGGPAPYSSGAPPGPHPGAYPGAAPSGYPPAPAGFPAGSGQPPPYPVGPGGAPPPYGGTPAQGIPLYPMAPATYPPAPGSPVPGYSPNPQPGQPLSSADAKAQEAGYRP